MNASIRARPRRRRASTMRSASAAVMASGFSHRTCLPARPRRSSTPRGGDSAAGCRRRRPRGRPGAPRRTCARGMPSSAATSGRRRVPRGDGHDARSGPRCACPGRPSRAMSAVERTPSEAAHAASSPRALGDGAEGDLEDPMRPWPGQHEDDRLGHILRAIIPASCGHVRCAAAAHREVGRDTARAENRAAHALLAQLVVERGVKPTWANFEARRRPRSGPRRPARLAMVDQVGGLRYGAGGGGRPATRGWRPSH